jgi:hypothetical protein
MVLTVSVSRTRSPGGECLQQSLRVFRDVDPSRTWPSAFNIRSWPEAD